MRYGIPLVGDRVAPRSIFADSVLVFALRRSLALSERRVLLEDHGLLDLAKVLSEQRIDVLICGGISRQEREFLVTRGVEIIDNVAGSIQELLAALQTGVLCPGFGLAGPSDSVLGERANLPILQGLDDGRAREGDAQAKCGPVDCLACRDWRCLQGERCELVSSAVAGHTVDRETERMFEAALDISSEEERTLCRLSELIYFCLEMRYQRIGVAFCTDLQKPTEILVRVLRRFAKVYPVCCKIGGVSALPLGSQAEREPKPARSVACNPQGQAEVLNRMGTDMNVLVGLCMGADCIFSRFSDAPVTTLFVKDRSLANNPIGAVYSDYYLKEGIQAAPCSCDEEPQ
jgi:uncharacterized metal-binding protein